MSTEELTKVLQLELHRVGCHPAPADGIWTASSQAALAQYNKYAGTKFDERLLGYDVLDAVKAKQSRVCPLVCDHGFKASGDACVKIACRAGYRVNDDNECAKVQENKPDAARNDASKRDMERKKVESAPAKPQASGQVICNTGGCRPVRPGCRVVQKWGGAAASYQVEECN
jgi:hypothetical protein